VCPLRGQSLESRLAAQPSVRQDQSEPMGGCSGFIALTEPIPRAWGRRSATFTHSCWVPASRVAQSHSIASASSTAGGALERSMVSLRGVAHVGADRPKPAVAQTVAFHERVARGFSFAVAIRIPDATEVGVESSLEGVVGVASRLSQHSNQSAWSPDLRRHVAASSCPGAAVTNKDLPNKGLEQPRRGGVPRLRGAIVRVSPCCSTQCWADVKLGHLEES
jgi:hypothetical protein